ncbi:hypothetical protein M3Y97_00730500 [Aphelenchoides bicaudatus]|nr:hypothetical protein M3Y97_00730500 [Aphelenchoides bicaudatus]
MVGKNLVVQYNGYPIDDVDADEETKDDKSSGEEPSSTTTDIVVLPNPTTSTRDFSSFDTQSFPLLNKVVYVFKQYEQRQRFLSASFQGKDMIIDEEPILVQRSIYSQMEHSNLRLLCMFVHEMLADCKLTVDQKFSLMKELCKQLVYAHRFGMTSRFFSKPGGPVMLFLGMAYEINNLQAFFGEHFNAKIQMSQTMFIEGHKANDKARKLRPIFIETIMLMALVVFEEVERQNIDSCNDYRDQLYSEFHRYLTKQYNSSEKASYRLMRLSSLLFEVKHLTILREQMDLMLDVFIPESIKGALETPRQVQNEELKQVLEAANEFVVQMSQMRFDNL